MTSIVFLPIFLLFLTINAQNAPPTISDVSYYYYSSLNPTNAIKLENGDITPLETEFQPNFYNIFLIHGWLDNAASPVNELLKTAILSHYANINLFVVDWSRPAGRDYEGAARNAPHVGRIAAALLADLSAAFRLPGARFTLIGFSMGAHVAGVAASASNLTVRHVLALDAAQPTFEAFPPADRLDAGDAAYVEAIHTAGAYVGYAAPVGDADFYPNSGLAQPGCAPGDAYCSHSRAFRLLAEAIAGARFDATACPNYVAYKLGLCGGNERALMGLLNPDQTIKGNFFLETNSEPPYSKDSRILNGNKLVLH